MRNSSSATGKGLLGTILVHAGLFLLLILVTFSVPAPQDTGEGILVNFGTGETGLGDIEPSLPAGIKESSPPPVQKKAAVQPPAVKAEKKSSKESLLSQETEEAPVVKKVDPAVEKKRREKIETDKKIREQQEADRLAKQQEEIERQRVEAEAKRTADIMNKTKNALANSKNSGTSSTSEGIAGGAGNQGDPRGSVDSKVRGEGGGLGTSGTGTGSTGPSFKLEGREVQKLPTPKYDYQEGGRVVVEVSVDRSGKVIQAIPGIKGSTTLDDYLLKVAKEAAMQTIFTAKQDAAPVQKGTITYNFILK